MTQKNGLQLSLEGKRGDKFTLMMDDTASLGLELVNNRDAKNVIFISVF